MNEYKFGIYHRPYEGIEYTPRYIEYAHVIRSYGSELSTSKVYTALAIL